MKVFKKIVTIFISVVLWCIILLAALFAFTTMATLDNNNVASIAGFSPLVVESDSMAPVFYKGDLIFIKKCDPNTLEEGDIVTFHTIINNSYALNTHRIIEIGTYDAGVREFTTKGDNNDISDMQRIVDSDIVGRYVGKLPKFGNVMDFLSSTVGFLVVIVIPMLLFFIYQIYHLITVSMKLKRAVAEEEAEMAKEKAEASEDGERAKMMAEAEAALAEAKRLKEEAAAELAKAKESSTDESNTDENNTDDGGDE